MFAIAMSLVLLTSTTLLLYQFWTGALLDHEDREAATRAFPARPEHLEGRTQSARTYRVDHAA
jgi:hypothetical protein